MIESLQRPGTEPYSEHFERLRSGPFAGEPDWLAEERRAAIERFVQLGWPDPGHVEWRHTGIGELVDAEFRLLADTGPRKAPTRLHKDLLFGLAGGTRLVFVDGRFVPELSERPEPGVRALPLAEALASEGELLRRHMFGGDSGSSLDALNSALFEDGCVIAVAPGARVAEPIHLVFHTTPAAEPRASFLRNLVCLGEGSEATILRSYTGGGSEPSWTSTVTRLVLGPGAVLDGYELQDQAPASFHFSTTAAELDRDASLRSTALLLGARVGRNELDVRFAGEGGSCEARGLYTVAGSERASCRTFVDHAVPNCTSVQGYRGILAEASRGVFQGRVLVRPAAQGTAARQENRNLVLSRNAWADTTPQLEIHADDVRCAHGAAIGEPDPEALFYLRSRGIGELEALRILIRGFANEITEHVRIEALRRRIESVLALKLAASAPEREG